MKNVQLILTIWSKTDHLLRFFLSLFFNIMLYKAFKNVAQALQNCDGAPPAGSEQDAAQRVKQTRYLLRGFT